MTKSKAAIISTLILAGAVSSLLLQHNATASLLARKESARQTAERIATLEADNERLSQIAARSDPSARDKQFEELQKLRAEAERLRAGAKDLPALQQNQSPAEPQHPQEPQTVFQIKETVAARHDYAQGWINAFLAYARENGGQLPKSFAQAEPFWPQNLSKPPDSSPDDFEILYDGSLNTLTNLDVIVLREKKLWPYGNEFFGSGKFGRHYGIADGHVDYCSSSDKTENGNFDNYEKEKLVRPNK